MFCYRMNRDDCTPTGLSPNILMLKLMTPQIGHCSRHWQPRKHTLYKLRITVRVPVAFFFRANETVVS
jgi:hypothetical protein